MADIPVRQPDGTIEWIDGDTYKTGGRSYRLPGVNAPEKGRLWDVGGGNTLFSPGQDTGERAAMRSLTDVLKATKPVSTGQENQGRIVGDLVNPETGASVTRTAVTSGILDPTFSTPRDVLEERRMNESANELLLTPSQGKVETIARQAKKQKEDAGVTPYIKGLASDEAQYAAFKQMTGVRALQDTTKEIVRLQEILDNDGDKFDKFFNHKLSDEARGSIQKQIDELKRAAIFAAQNNDLVQNVMFRKGDRTIDNKSYNPTTDSLLKGVYDARTSLYGLTRAVGDTAGWEDVSKWAKMGAANSKIDSGSLAETIGMMDAKKQLTNGDWDWKDITVTGEAVINTLASSVPSFGAMIIGSTVGGPVGAALTIGKAAGATAGGFIAPWMIYTGQNYEAQPEGAKNAAAALAYGGGMAVLDNLGFKSLKVPGTQKVVNPGMIFKGAERDTIINAIAVQKNISIPAAIKEFNEASKAVIVNMAKNGSEIAARQWRSKEAALHSIGHFTNAMAQEGATETAQTVLEEMAATGKNFDLDVRYNTGFWEKLEESLYGGAAAGGTIHAAGDLAAKERWRVLENYQALDRIKQTEGNAVRSQIRSFGADKSINIKDHIKNVRTNPTKGLMEQQGLGTTMEKVKAAILSPLSFFRHLGETTIPSVLDEKTGKWLQNKTILKSLMTSGILAGDHFDGRRQRIISDWKTQTKDSLATMLKVPESKLDGMLRDAWKTSWSKGQATGNAPLDAWFDSLTNSSDAVRQTIEDMGSNADNWLVNPSHIFEEGSFDSRVLGANQGFLRKWLMSKNETEADADKTIDALLSGDPQRVKGASQRVLKRLGAFTAPELSHIFNANVMDAYENHKHQVANGVAKETMLGANGEKLAMLLEQAQAAGEFASEHERAFVTQQVQDWFKIINSDYHSLRDTPTLEAALSWTSTLTMMAYLGKAPLSSLPELAFSLLGVAGQNIAQQLRIFGKELGKNLGDAMMSAASTNAGVLKDSWGIPIPQSSSAGRINRKLFELNEEIKTATGTKLAKLQKQRDELASREQAS